MSSIWTIRRSATDSKLTGLCGGIAQHWGVDPVLIRVGCVLLALSGGIGLVLYVAGWLLIPVEGRSEAPINDILGEQTRRWPRELWIAIVAVCCIIAFTVLSPVTPFGFGPAVVLALIWYFGYYKHRPQRHDSAGALAPVDPRTGAPVPPQPQFYNYSGPSTPFTEAATAWRQRIEEAQRSTQPQPVYRGTWDAPPNAPYEDTREPVGPAASLPPARPFGEESVEYSSFLAAPDPVGLYAQVDPAVAATAVQTSKRSAAPAARRLRLVALVAVGLTLSGLGIASALGVAVTLATYFAATLLILGLTLIAAARYGRARGILPVALLVLLGTIGTSVAGPVSHEQGWGAQQVRFTTPAELAPGNRHELGELKVDLRDLATTTNVSYTAHVETGNLEVLAPKSTNVVIKWQVDSGAVIVDGAQVEAGTDLHGVQQPVRVDPRKKTLTLNLSVDRGAVQVTR